MVPDPSDAVPLPPRPDLEQYKKQAKELVRACQSGAPDAPRAWTREWLRTLAGLHGVAPTADVDAAVERRADRIAELARAKLASRDHGAPGALSQAQFVIARAHGFTSWPRFAEHVEALCSARSPVSRFEAAVDAVVAGDATTLARLLHEEPDLARARSTREHGATLLHYVAANGFEDYRQKSPRNAVAIAEILLDAGAEVDAVPNGTLGTTLGLVATSVHPERAGVQLDLLATLIRRGASVDGAPDGWNPLIASLRNGRGRAALFLARHGARLDLEGAAGVGRLDVVERSFDAQGRLRSDATREQLESGWFWACEYGHDEVVRFLLAHGVDVRTGEGTNSTGLHWAVVGAQLATIDLLLSRGAPLEAVNVYGGTVLGQALWCAVNGDLDADYAPIVERLVAAGASIRPGTLAWLSSQHGGSAGTKQRIAEILRRHGASD